MFVSQVRKEEVREEEHEEEVEPGVFVKKKRIVKLTTIRTSSYLEVPLSPEGKPLLPGKIIIRGDTAFVVPMHCNKPNITEVKMTKVRNWQ